jgi:hypothetical protein
MMAQDQDIQKNAQEARDELSKEAQIGPPQ